MSKELNDRIAQLITGTADYVGADWEGGAVSELAELVLDADRLEAFAKDRGRREVDDDAIRTLRAMSWDAQMKLAKKLLR